jgi:hypothetical protein
MTPHEELIEQVKATLERPLTYPEEVAVIAAGDRPHEELCEKLEQFVKRVSTAGSIYDFKVVCDETNNSEQDFAANRMNVDISIPETMPPKSPLLALAEQLLADVAAVMLYGQDPEWDWAETPRVVEIVEEAKAAITCFVNAVEKAKFVFEWTTADALTIKPDGLYVSGRKATCVALTAHVWAQLLANEDFTSAYNPIATYQQILRGYLGCYGDTQIVTDAYNQPLLKWMPSSVGFTEAYGTVEYLQQLSLEPTDMLKKYGGE